MNILYITYFLNGFLMIAMPLALAIYLTRRWKLSWRFWFVGAAVFILSQVGHIPFNYGLTALFQNHLLPSPPIEWKNIFNAIVLGLSAGLFEELSRYAMFRWWLKDARSWRKGVLAGAGHGGVEAIILGVLVLLGYVNLILLQNPAILATVPADQLEMVRTQVAAYWSAPWYSTMLGAFERLCTISVQICLAVIVLQTFTRKQWFWVWLAVLYHAVIDASAVFLMPLVGVYWLEAIIAGFSLLSLLIIFKLRQPEPVNPEPAPVISAPQVTLNPPEETPENLDGSRYQ
jgi:uncharacterized membrane protein YhfC